jgi:hypothetical protein
MNLDDMLIFEAYKKKQLPPQEPEDEKDTEIVLPDEDTGGEIVVRPDYKPEPVEDRDTDVEDGDIEDGDIEDGDGDGDGDDGDIEDGDDGDIEDGDGDIEDGGEEDKPALPAVVKSIPKETPQPNSRPQSSRSGDQSTRSSSGSGFPRSKCEDKDKEELCDLYYSLRKGSEGDTPEAKVYKNKFNKFQKTCGDLIDKFDCSGGFEGPDESKPESEPQSTPKSTPKSNSKTQSKSRPKSSTSSKPNSKPQSKPKPTASTNTENLTEWDHMFNYIFLALYNNSDDSDFREFLSFAATYFQPREHDFRKDFIVQQEVNLAKIEKVIEMIKTQTKFGYKIDYKVEEKLKHLKQLISHFTGSNKINKPMSPQRANTASSAVPPRQEQETQAEKNRREHREFMDMWKMA